MTFLPASPIMSAQTKRPRIKYLLLLLFLQTFGAVNPAPRIIEIHPDIPNNIVWAKVENVTVGTIITVYSTKYPAKMGILDSSTFIYSFYGYDEVVTIAVPMTEIGYFWVTQTPYYPVPL